MSPGTRRALPRVAGLLAGAIGLVGASCDPAGAQPNATGSARPPVRATSATSGISAPAGWQALPAIAEASRAAIGTSVAVEGAEAWGEPAMGCYAVWLAVRGGAADAPADRVAADVLAGFAARPGIALTDVVAPTGGAGVLAASFARPPYRGRLRAQLGGGRITALACFANVREPVACEAACTGLLDRIPDRIPAPPAGAR
ncbi:MAG: hypothetical protein ACTHU0_11635 [Kofleriaceae bacterium]